MPALPEDIIDRLRALESRVKQLYTAANSRPPLNKFTNGTLQVFAPGATDPIFEVGHGTGQEYGLSLRRQTGEPVLDVWSGSASATATTLQPFRMHDPFDHELISDDIKTGGLARPWLAMLAPQDTSHPHWPQTTATTWTTVARSQNPLWQPKMRLLIATATSTGATGQVRVLVNGTPWGDPVNAGANLDRTDFTVPAASFTTAFGTSFTVEIQAMLTSAAGTIYAQTVAMYGTQS
ncbi:hypothetical protein [Actinacidiphila acidipaludis]|uniref:Uncharacterized protein n=1 Tax=Actinacidiphila acidipaludis TaxID=2873382 RepID=A0ABS7Q4J3_9ACTN|nr:hypothetical protein [Streptomyces acidipaludis]MBY8878078.1 hypothetical protein [Streptomyces acidipaludis]